MLFKTIVVSALAAVVAADYASILSSLQLVDKDIAKLNGSVLAFDGDILLGVPVLVDSSTLENDLKSGTKTASASANLTTTDALNLVAPLQRLTSDTNITLSNLIAKYSLFKSDDLTGIVKGVLQDSKKDADAYSAAIIAKVPSSLQSIAQSLYAPIDTSFTQAIAVYSQ